MAVRQCQVCEEAKSKYKCPICLIPYCSLSCFKKHKEVPCSKSSPPEEKPTKVPCSKSSLPEEKPSKVSCSKSSPPEEKPTVLTPERPLQVDDPSWMLQKNQYEILANSNEIRDALKDSRLREIICKIDSSTNGREELDKAMEEETFRELADRILALVG